VVSYLRKRKAVLSDEQVEIKRMDWRKDTLKVQWQRRGVYNGKYSEVSIVMISSFVFIGARILEQTIARDVNAFLQQTGQVKSAEYLEQEREYRLENAVSALLLLDKGGRVLDEDHLSELFDIDAVLELQATGKRYRGLEDTQEDTLLQGVRVLRGNLARLNLRVDIDAEPGSVRIDTNVVSVRWHLTPVVESDNRGAHAMWSVM
jgi:hypothetical protein